MQSTVKKTALLSLLAVVLAAPVSKAALAATNIGTVTSLTTFGASTALGTFDDLYNFAVSPNSGAVISATTFTFGMGGTTMSAMELYLGTFLTAADLIGHTAIPTTLLHLQSGGTMFTALSQMADYPTLSSAAYTLRVTGSSTVPALPYTGVIALAPVMPVPEPETYAMVLAGLGMMGAIMRRRKIR